MTIGGTTYTFAAAINAQSPADTVLIGADVQSTLANLMAAINATAADSGTTFSAGTVANNSVTATGYTATSLSLQALTGGIAGDSLSTTSEWTKATFGSSDLSGGVDAVPSTATFTVPAGTLPTAGNTVDVAGTTYTFVGAVANLTAANDVLIGNSVQSALTNLAAAINGTTIAGQQGSGITYGPGTVANQSVEATNPTATTLTLQALTGGAGGDTLATSTTWTGGAFAVTNLSGGTTGVAASATLSVPASSLPNTGGTPDTVDVAGTTYTFVAAVGDLTSANTVLVGLDTASTLANLAAAINGTSIDSTQGQGITYGTGTVANTLVTATGSTATTVSLQAIQTGASGNSYAVSTTWSNALLGAGALAGGVNAIDATGTLNVAIPLPTAGQTVTVGGTTYTFAAAITGLSPADTVKIGNSVQSTLANLAEAINGTTGKGSAFSSATQPNGSVTATSTATTVVVQALQTGTGGNSTPTSTAWTGGTFGAADLSGGVNAAAAAGAYTVPITLPAAGDTVTVGATTYTFVGTAAALTAPNDVLIGPDVASTLANLAGAINASSSDGQGAGITYGTGTIANTSVTATGSTATAVTLRALQSGSVGNIIPTTTDWTAGSFGAGDLTGGTDAGTFSTPITVYDSLGNSHVLTFNFTKSSAGTWAYQITIPAADVGATGNPQVVGTGTLQFGPDGNLISPPADVQGISISNLADGAKTMSLNWQLFSSPGTGVITQTAEPSATSGTKQDGYSAGTLQSYSINSSGVIDGVLSNGQTVALGQIALATFANYDGLANLGSDDYQASLASGAASVAAPGTGGSGTLDGGSLEASNVDIATAFTMLIQAERGYEANAKAISTADTVMQASINLIQG
jgi:flagellar hook protein FlgE